MINFDKKIRQMIWLGIMAVAVAFMMALPMLGTNLKALGG